MTNFNVKTMCKVLKNSEELTESINLFIAFNASRSLFCFFVSFGCFSFLFLVLLCCHFYLLIFVLA